MESLPNEYRLSAEIFVRDQGNYGSVQKSQDGIVSHINSEAQF